MPYTIIATTNDLIVGGPEAPASTRIIGIAIRASDLL